MNNVDMQSTSDSRPASRWLNRTVLGAGLTSALGDFCYETSNVILPGFLAMAIGTIAMAALHGEQTA